ncbi:rhodanese-like domain-containing protein [Dokdonia ponticola]|uniref:Rhodanese-like domain-containing protein n=1 Tax=Dokdonia ponticola TaxID=2041041 RepID=A0ABV9HT75_9FLAO
MKDITVAEWKSLIATDDNAVVLDVRTQDEVDEGALENSKHIDIFMGQGFINEVKKLDPEKNYYIYCRSGGRSVQACTIMEQLGFKNTYNMLGGYNAWVEN